MIVRGRTLDGAPPVEGPVLVGVDGSESCRAAVEVAFEEAAARRAILVAVNVWSDVSVQPSLGAVPEDPHWSRIQTGEEIVLAERLAGTRNGIPTSSSNGWSRATGPCGCSVNMPRAHSFSWWFARARRIQGSAAGVHQQCSDPDRRLPGVGGEVRGGRGVGARINSRE